MVTGFAQVRASFSLRPRLVVIGCLAWEEIEYMGSHESASSSDLPHSPFTPATEVKQTPEELKEEQRKLRRLQMMMDMVMSVIGQDDTLSIDEAAQMVADSRRVIKLCKCRSDGRIAIRRQTRIAAKTRDGLRKLQLEDAARAARQRA